MRVLTYNIHGCVGLDRRKDPGRILEVIESVDADIIALQEVDRNDRADRCLIESLRERATHTVIYGPTLERGGGEYGNLLLSRYPVRSHQNLDLSVRGREPRGAICAVATRGAENISIIATHLGLGMAERRRQVERLLDGFRAHPGAPAADLHLLLGDFNEWFVPGRPLRRLRRHFGGSHARRTFPSAFPLFKLDRIWVKPGHRLKSLHPVRTRLARRASDHLPLVAELEDCSPRPGASIADRPGDPGVRARGPACGGGGRQGEGRSPPS